MSYSQKLTENEIRVKDIATAQIQKYGRLREWNSNDNMDHSQRAANGDSTNATSGSSYLMPNVLFREIHKNAFLKRHLSDRRAGFPKKSDRVWVVFCVHDDVEPFLEIYPDQKVALTHKPEWFASLSNVLHVSPTICGHEDEYEFAITLSFQVVRLSAPSWESMMEWVETIRNKLRELKVLCPKENIYSKMPEQKQPLLPTRDPNSPLPLPPEGPSILLPGVELVHIESRISSLVTDDSETGRHQRNVHSRSNESDRRVLNKRINPNEREGNPTVDTVQLNEASGSSTATETSSERSITTNPIIQGSKMKVRKAASTSQTSPSTSGIPPACNITVIEVSAPSINENDVSSDINQSDDENDVFSKPVKQNAVEETAPRQNSEETHYEHVLLSSVPVGRAQFSSSKSKPTMNYSQVSENKSKKPHSTNLLIGVGSSSQNSSQEKNIARTNNISLSSNVKDVLVNNQTSITPGRNATTVECEINDKNPLSPQIQSKLEKVSIAGLIPRVSAKSSKISSFKSASPSSKDLILNVSEGRRYSSENECGFTTDSDHPGAATNGECSRAAGTSGIFVPAYSQVKKVPKAKAKNEKYKDEEPHPSPKASPLVPKRKLTEIQVLEVESHGNRKLGNPIACKNQVNLSDTKISCNINLKASGNRKQEFESASGNSDITRNLATSSSIENKNMDNNSLGPSTSGSSCQINMNKKESFTSANNNHETEPIIALVQPAVGVISVEDIPLIGGHQRRRRRSSSSDPAPSSSVPSSRGIGGADRIRVNVPNSCARETSRNESEIRPACQNGNTTEQNSQMNNASQSSRLTLREKQVLQLKKEMLHPGGVRLQLRRKDCTGSIAFVDVLNGVWIAGWKQKEHPLLYNALHIGDQLISIGDVLVRSSAEAQKLIRNSTSLYIEFIIRRVPFGNVFALQRSSDGLSLGIVQEGNTAEIKDVVPNSVAARQGLTSKTPSCDGLSLTTWFLTEINGRPLNLFFKDSEVKDRLNAVGKEISILVQPYDFVKLIKKQLKNIRSYKDYIVQ